MAFFFDVFSNRRHNSQELYAVGAQYGGGASDRPFSREEPSWYVMAKSHIDALAHVITKHGPKLLTWQGSTVEHSRGEQHGRRTLYVCPVSRIRRVFGTFENLEKDLKQQTETIRVDGKETTLTFYYGWL